MNLPYIKPEQRYGAEFSRYASFFRKMALVVDVNPNKIMDFCDNPAIQFLLCDDNSTTFERTCYLEAFAYGDPGVMLACPGPSLSGLIMRELGTKEQIEYFYQYIRKKSARTFFALTELDVGSDAGGLKTKLTFNNNRYLLNGEKCLFGNGAVGAIGVVLARTHSGPVGIRAVLITPEILESKHSCIERRSLPMTGLRGAQIGYMRFDNCTIPKDNLLGEHLRPMQRGMMAVIKTFNRLRTGVGALAIGQAQSVLDFIYENKKEWNPTERKAYIELFHKIETVRQMLRNSARTIDINFNDYFAVSISKLQATRIAEQVIIQGIAMLNPTVLLENQWLSKVLRDSFAWDYMEGTQNMQLKTIYQSHKLSKQVENKA